MYEEDIRHEIWKEEEEDEEEPLPPPAAVRHADTRKVGSCASVR